MENAPSIILFWFFIMADFVLMIAATIGTCILLKKGKGKARVWGIICLILSILCVIPFALVVGYVLYLYLA